MMIIMMIASGARLADLESRGGLVAGDDTSAAARGRGGGGAPRTAVEPDSTTAPSGASG